MTRRKNPGKPKKWPDGSPMYEEPGELSDIEKEALDETWEEIVAEEEAKKTHAPKPRTRKKRKPKPP